jgi:branched-chain amino acid transport system ATP-binding protein
MSAGYGRHIHGPQEAAGDLPVLELSRVTMQFGGLKAVCDLDLRIMHGELMGLIGPNGAGKTTVFNVVTGVYAPT